MGYLTLILLIFMLVASCSPGGRRSTGAVPVRIGFEFEGTDALKQQPKQVTSEEFNLDAPPSEADVQLYLQPPEKLISSASDIFQHKRAFRWLSYRVMRGDSVMSSGATLIKDPQVFEVEPFELEAQQGEALSVAVSLFQVDFASASDADSFCETGRPGLVRTWKGSSQLIVSEEPMFVVRLANDGLSTVHMTAAAFSEDVASRLRVDELRHVLVDQHTGQQLDNELCPVRELPVRDSPDGRQFLKLMTFSAPLASHQLGMKSSAFNARLLPAGIGSFSNDEDGQRAFAELGVSLAAKVTLTGESVAELYRVPPAEVLGPVWQLERPEVTLGDFGDLVVNNADVVEFPWNISGASQVLFDESKLSVIGSNATCKVEAKSNPMSQQPVVVLHACVGDGLVNILLAGGIAQNEFGIVSKEFVSGPIWVDNTPPTAAVVSILNAGSDTNALVITAGEKVTTYDLVSVTGTEGTVEYKIGVDCTVATDYSTTTPKFNDPRLLDGSTLVVCVRDTDAAGNSSTTASLPFTVGLMANVAPTIATAGDASKTTNEDTAATINLAIGADVDTADALTFTIVTQPTKGTLGTLPSNAKVASTLSFTPTVNLNGSDSFVYKICDNGTPVLCTADQTVTLSIISVNDNPVLNASATLNYIENETAKVLDSGITITDDDNTTMASATVTISAGLTTGDLLEFVDQNGISGSYVAGTGVLTLSGSSSIANYVAALSSVTFRSTSDHPTATSATRTITWVVNDGAGANNLSVADTSSVSITDVNDNPVATAGGTLSYTENGSAAVIDGSVTLSDEDNTDFTLATVTISAGRTAGDVLSFTNQSGITGTYDAGNGMLTLSGGSSVANYQAALRSVKFHSTSNHPTVSSLTRTITWIVNDGSGANNLSVADTSSVSITAVNDNPVLNASATLNYTENETAKVLDSGITITDDDNTTMAAATVTISAGLTTGDLLEFVDQNGISGSYVAGTGVLTLSGFSSIANYVAALRSVTFRSTSNHPTSSSATRTITWVVNDGSGANNLSAAANSSVSIASMSDTIAPAVMFSDPGALFVKTSSTTTFYTVAFTDNLGVVSTDAQLKSLISIDATGGASCTLGISGTSSPYTVGLSACTGNGTVGIRVSAGAQDAAGNTSSMSYSPIYVVVDNTLPTANIATPSASVISSSGDSVTYSVSFADNVGVVSSSSSNISVFVVSGFPNCSSSVTPLGSHSYTVAVGSCTGHGVVGVSVVAGAASDAANNISVAYLTSSAQHVSVAVDTVAPTVTLNETPFANNSYSSGASFTFSANEGASFTCKWFEAGVLVATMTSCTSPVSRTSGVSGTKRIEVTATDAAGNTSAVQSITWSNYYSVLISNFNSGTGLCGDDASSYNTSFIDWTNGNCSTVSTTGSVGTYLMLSGTTQMALSNATHLTNGDIKKRGTIEFIIGSTANPPSTGSVTLLRKGGGSSAPGTTDNGAGDFSWSVELFNGGGSNYGVAFIVRGPSSTTGTFTTAKVATPAGSTCFTASSSLTGVAIQYDLSNTPSVAIFCGSSTSPKATMTTGTLPTALFVGWNAGSEPLLQLGALSNGFIGNIDQLRISNILRYSTQYVQPTAVYTPD